MINSAGAVYLVEEQLDVDKAPAPVKAALEARGKILILESVTKGGKTTYEGQVQTKAGKKGRDRTRRQRHADRSTGGGRRAWAPEYLLRIRHPERSCW